MQIGELKISYSDKLAICLSGSERSRSGGLVKADDTYVILEAKGTKKHRYHHLWFPDMASGGGTLRPD